MNESKKGLLDKQLRVEHDQFSAGRYEIVTLVELEKFDENLVLILFCRSKKTKQNNTLTQC
jgi:hypothetical protein